MALESSMLPLGTKLPMIELFDLDNNRQSLSSIAHGRPLLVCFLCNHCPYVKHIERGMAELEQDYPNVAIVGICSNDSQAYPEDDVQGLKDQVRRSGWGFTYLIDSDQCAAHQFQAVCTPDFYLFDREGTLVYRGAFDDSRPKQSTPVTGRDIRTALDHLAGDTEIPGDQRPSMGCGIKWKPGNDPQG